MSTKTAPKADAEATKDAEKPKGSKKLLLVIIAGLVLALGGVGGYLMLSGGGKPGTSAAPKPKPKAGAILALDAVTVNLTDGHYLKVKVSLQLTEKAAKETDGSKALDQLIAVFSDRSMGELSSADGRAKAKAELLTKLAKAYPDEIMDIYFTQFVMQ